MSAPPKSIAIQTQQLPCGDAGDAIGAGVAALAANIGLGLLSGLAGSAVTMMGAGSTPDEIAASAKRGLVVAAAAQGIAGILIAVMAAERHPEFAGAMGFIGVSAVGTAGLGAMIPSSRFMGTNAASDLARANQGAQPTQRPAAGLPYMYGQPAIDPLRAAGTPRMHKSPLDMLMPPRQLRPQLPQTPPQGRSAAAGLGGQHGTSCGCATHA